MVQVRTFAWNARSYDEETIVLTKPVLKAGKNHCGYEMMRREKSNDARCYSLSLHLDENDLRNLPHDPKVFRDHIVERS